MPGRYRCVPISFIANTNPARSATCGGGCVPGKPCPAAKLPIVNAGFCNSPQKVTKMQKQKKPAESMRRRPPKVGKTEGVLRAANGYIVRHYPFGCLGNNPRRLV